MVPFVSFEVCAYVCYVFNGVRNQTSNKKYPLELIKRRSKVQKQPPSGVPRKRCSENMQQIYRITPMPKCDFNKVALQLY